MSTADGIRQGIYRNALVRRIAQWLDAVPHPPIVCEITPEYVAAVRWTRSGTSVESVAIEPIPHSHCPDRSRDELARSLGGSQCGQQSIFAFAHQMTIRSVDCAGRGDSRFRAAL